MLVLNLVSQEIKQEIKLRHIYKLFKKMGYILVATVLIIAIILVAAKIIIKKNLDNIIEQTSLVTGNNQSYTSKVKKINSQINSVMSIQKDHANWPNLIKILAEKTPAGIKISYIKINKENSSIKLGGKADLRDNLLSLKQNLENLKIFSNLDFPLENILEKKDINFEINAKINLNEF